MAEACLLQRERKKINKEIWGGRAATNRQQMKGKSKEQAELTKPKREKKTRKAKEQEPTRKLLLFTSSLPFA
jgi:hypothetical protein